jgi:serine/threonine protein kinase
MTIDPRSQRRASDTQTATAAVADGARLSEHPRPPASPGRALIGRYQLLELIGTGGAGEVYAGHDPQLDRPVAVKRLRADVASSADRVQLAHEARINARLEHPNIVRVYDFLTVGSDDYIVSEYIDGSSLAELLTQERTDVEGHLVTALAISRGLSYAHAAGVVHLDLKTENVLIGRDGVPKIADFGIAQVSDPGQVQTQLEGAVIRGTFRSMSPEQTLASPADARSDLFSFGTLLYEMFGGVSPFHVRGNAAETIRRIREFQPLPLRELRADVPPAVSELVQQLHRKDPADRPRAARDVEAVLRELLERRTRRTSPLGSAEPPVERRLLSLLSIELCVSSPSSSMERTESYLRAVARFHKAAHLLVERHDGHLLSALGHRAVICLGYPRAHDNNCERAARLFSDLRRELDADASSGQPELRAGLDVGDMLLLGGLLAGPPLSASAALCEAAGPGELLVSSRAQRILRRFFAFDFRGMLARREGQGADTLPLQHHALIEGASTPGAGAVRAAQGKSPLIGRESELRVLFEAFRSAEDGAIRSVLVVGSAGVGKSRLLRSFSDRLAESNALVVALRARSEDQYSPFAPFAELSWLGPDAEEPRSRVRASEPPGPQPTGDPTSPGARPGPPQAPAETYRQHMIDTLIARLLTAARGRGLVLFVEDVQWLDHSSFELLRTLEACKLNVPVLVVLSGRPESVSDVTVRLRVQTLTVSRLTPTQALEVVQGLGGRHFSHRVAMQIVETADGLPLLLEELTLAMAEGGDVAGSAATALLQVPSSLTESLDRRLDLLGVARGTAELLATLGRETLCAIVEKVSDLPPRELSAQLARSCALGLVIEEGEGPSRTLRFRHGLLRDAIYQRLPAARREELHRRIAAAAEANFGGWLAERPDLFALHFARSGQWLKALELATRAGEQAASKSCHFEACVHLYNALDLLERHIPGGVEHDRWELSIRRLLCPSLNASDGWAAETVQENNARLGQLGREGEMKKPPAELWALFAHALLRHDRHGVGEALMLLAAAEPTPARDAVLAIARGNLEFYQGEFSRAERSLCSARQLLELADTREAVLACGQELLVEGPCYLGWIYGIQGRATLSLEQCREMESSPEPLVVARAFGMLFGTGLGILRRDHAAPGERAAQQARAEALLDLADLLRHPIFRAVADVALGRLRVARGEREDGLASMRRGYDLYEQSGMQLALAEYAGFVAEAYLEAGEVARARELLDRVREPAAHPYSSFYRPEFLRIEAETLIAEARLSEATQVLEAAARACAVMAIERQPQMFLDRIKATHQRLRHAWRSAERVSLAPLSALGAI